MKIKNIYKIIPIICFTIILIMPIKGSAQLWPPTLAPLPCLAFPPPIPIISYPSPIVRNPRVLTTVSAAPVLTSAGLTITSLLATPPPTLLNTVTVANTNLATSNWIGTWRSLIRLAGGDISFILTQDVISGVVTGTAVFANHPLVLSGFPVSGIIDPVGVDSTFQLTGTYINPFSLRLFNITLNCNVLSTNIITGTYAIYNPLQSDYGTMDLIRP